MEPLLLAGHPALEFLNTSWMHDGESVELLGEGAALLDWMVAASLLDRTQAAGFKRRVRASELDDAAAEARRMRGWAASWLTHWTADPAGAFEPELFKLNGLLLRGDTFRQLVRDRSGAFAIVERARARTAGEIVALVARQFAELLAREEPSLVKRCASASCTLWFLDRTRAHRRRFCSATACGNREKVTAFRARQRQAEQGSE